MAHYDSARSALLYAPGRVDGFRRSFVTNAALAYLTPLLAALAALAPDLRFVLLFLGLYFLANAALFVLRERREPIVNGANDNASGVAAAVEVALRLRARGHGRVTLLLTGCEEVGARGAAAYAATLEANADTLVLNLDNVGAGALHLARGEGMLGYSPYRPEGLEAARTALQDRLPELEYRLAYFDTRPFARRGLPCLSLIALEGGRIPNWHWPSDTLERVDVAAVTRAADAAEAIALQWLGAEPK
nr:M20/M25/M40 family metallo-hydrolase [Deinobacterium chartae]